jgi:hypothetical protein
MVVRFKLLLSTLNGASIFRKSDAQRLSLRAALVRSASLFDFIACRGCGISSKSAQEKLGRDATTQLSEVEVFEAERARRSRWRESL